MADYCEYCGDRHKREEQYAECEREYIRECRKEDHFQTQFSYFMDLPKKERWEWLFKQAGGELY